MAACHEKHAVPMLSDQPIPSKPAIGYTSDVVAEQLKRLGLSYLALVPGSSYRGLHDSLVNYGGNVCPEMIVTLHEEHAVAIAHGYAKIAKKPMAVGLHANVGMLPATLPLRSLADPGDSGLMHAAMAIFNAFTGI